MKRRVDIQEYCNCGTCLYWVTNPCDSSIVLGEDTGECRRYPPVSNISHEEKSDELDFFPLTNVNTSCGEYKAAEFVPEDDL